MHYVGRRASFASPLRSLPLYRTVESVLGPSRQVCVEAELRLSRQSLVAEMARYAKACAALGAANRLPINWKGAGPGLRRWHQVEAMHAINGHRKLVRAATRRVEAAEAAMLTLTPSDAFCSPYLAKLAGVAAQQVAA